MKLHRLTLKNFRAVRDVTVCPADSGVTVIEGRNEAGKSSLAEALNMLLTVKDRSKAQAVKNVSPADSGAGPEITAELSSGPYRFEYHKRFLSKPSTTLRVDTPKPESLSGDEAHQRVEAILEETMDAELWSALRVEQGSSHALADLSRQAALSAALDEAAAGSRGDGSDEDLFTRVENLFFGFFTRRPGNPEGKVLVEARERVQRLETTAEELAEEQRRLDGDVNKARELGREIARDEQAMQPLKDEETNARESLRAAQERQQVVERLRGEATLAASRRDTASLAHKTRQGMLEQLASHSATSDELLAQSQAAEAAIDAAREQQRDSKAALDTAQARADEAAGLALAAQAAVAASRAAKELERLQRTREDARQVAAQLRKSERFLAACTVTPEALAKARDAESHHLQVTSKATSRAPRLQVTALTPLKIDHDGSVNDVPAGSTHEAGLTDGAVLTIADVAELRLEAGGDQNEHQRAVADSARALKAALAALGTASTADAEKQLRDRAAHEAKLRALTQQQSALLNGSTTEQLDARIDAQVAAQDKNREISDLDTIEEQFQKTRDAQEAAVQAVQSARQLLAEHTARLETLERAELQRGAQREAATAASAAIEQQLENERSAASDDELRRRASDATAALEKATALVAQAERDADAHPLETARHNADTARNALDHATSHLNDCKTRLEALRAALSVREEKGLYEASTAVSAELEAARGDLDSLLRQANAAKLLFQTLSAARQEQRSRYLLPLAEKMEQLGKAVFGDSFRVTLDDDLGIASRTLDGITVPFDSLSLGTKEQLSVLQRIATALCVNEQDGVPLILDDVLGHADPERLRAMNAVLGLAGKRTQVIVTTCYPERYRHITRAETIVLP